MKICCSKYNCIIERNEFFKYVDFKIQIPLRIILPQFCAVLPKPSPNMQTCLICHIYVSVHHDRFEFSDCMNSKHIRPGTDQEVVRTKVKEKKLFPIESLLPVGTSIFMSPRCQANRLDSALFGLTRVVCQLLKVRTFLEFLVEQLTKLSIFFRG